MSDLAADGAALRKRGRRKAGRGAGGGRPTAALRDAFHTLQAPGYRTKMVMSTHIDPEQMSAYSDAYRSHPTIRVATSLVKAALCSGGIRLMRGGSEVKLTSAFQAHLDGAWMDFVREAVDALLTFGMVPVALIEDARAPFAADDEDEDERVATTATGAPRGRQARSGGGGGPGGEVLVPVVPPLGTYKLSFDASLRRRYKLEYRENLFGRDEEPPLTDVFVHSAPDEHGNLTSALGTVFELIAFERQLVGYALAAEQVRSRTNLVLQPAPKPATQASPLLSSENMFFDAESRAHAANEATAADGDAATNAAALAMACSVLNRLQTTVPGGGPGGGAQHGQQRSPYDATGQTSAFTAPDVPPRVFCAPSDQVVVPGAQLPVARTDLVAIQNYVSQAICAALNVPSSMVLEARFVGNAASNLLVFNSSVNALAQTISTVLSHAYARAYAPRSRRTSSVTEERLELVLQPLASTDELTRVFSAGLLDAEALITPTAHALGLSTDAANAALERHKARAEEAKKALEAAGQAGAPAPGDADGAKGAGAEGADPNAAAAKGADEAEPPKKKQAS